MHNQLWLVSMVVCACVCACFVGCGSKSASSAAGTYELDRVAMAATLVDEILRNAPEAERGKAETIAQATAKAKDQAETMSSTSVLNADGTWTSTANMGGGGFTAKGTWTLEGTQLTFTTTEQDGKKEKNPETNVATLEGSVLTIQPEGAPFKLVYNRK